jgi:DNA-binding IclR family transcriptional regulator
MANKRTNSDYELETVSKAIRVLEAIEGERGEAVPFTRIVSRTGFSRNFVLRALATWELNGYAIKSAGNRWSLGKRLLTFSGRYSELALRALTNGKS